MKCATATIMGFVTACIFTSCGTEHNYHFTVVDGVVKTDPGYNHVVIGKTLYVYNAKAYTIDQVDNMVIIHGLTIDARNKLSAEGGSGGKSATTPAKCCKDLACADGKICHVYTVTPTSFGCDCAPETGSECSPPCESNKRCYCLDGKCKCGGDYVTGGGMPDIGQVLVYS